MLTTVLFVCGNSTGQPCSTTQTDRVFIGPTQSGCVSDAADVSVDGQNIVKTFTYMWSQFDDGWKGTLFPLHAHSIPP